MTIDEYNAWIEEQAAIAAVRKSIVWLFVLSLLVVTAPLLGPIAGLVAVTKRKLLAGANGTYLAMGYGSAALGGLCWISILAVVLGA